MKKLLLLLFIASSAAAGTCPYDGWVLPQGSQADYMQRQCEIQRTQSDYEYRRLQPCYMQAGHACQMQAPAEIWQ